MIKICERCNKKFKCIPEDIINCECSKFQLNQQTQAILKEKYMDCLCSSCLIELYKELNEKA